MAHSGGNAHSAGLKNMGNTCFMNAVEQVMLHALPFQRLLGAKLLSAPMLLEQELLLELRDPKKSVVEPSAHYAQLLQSACYEKGNQQDCAEFYEWTMGRQADPPNIAPLPFQGHCRSDVFCLKCFDSPNNGNLKPFFSISVPVCRPVKMVADGVISELDTDIHSLNEALHATFESLLKRGCPIHPLGHENEYASRMIFRITEAPQILMVHLKRTVSDEQNMSFKKRHQVEFPFVLDMTGYKWNSDQAAVYDLQGVIVHVGDSFQEGPYYAVVRDGNAWWEFDDEKVTRRTAEDVLKEEAYLLCYILRDGSTAGVQAGMHQEPSSSSAPNRRPAATSTVATASQSDDHQGHASHSDKRQGPRHLDESHEDWRSRISGMRLPDATKKRQRKRRNQLARLRGQMLSDMQAVASANLMPHVHTSASVAGSSVHGDTDESGSPFSTQSCDAFLDVERGSGQSAQEAVVEPGMPATAMPPNASGRQRAQSRLASVALPEPSSSYGLRSSDLTSLDQGLQEASQSGLVGPYSEMHPAAELAAAAQPVSHESNEAATLPDASHIAPTPIPHADHSLPAASQSRLGLLPHPKAPTAQSRRDSSMQTVPVARAQPASDLSAQAPARANTSAATAGKTGSAARNAETANTEARAAVARKAQQAVDKLLVRTAQTGQTRKQEAAWAAKRKVVEEQVRKARADRAAKEAADKAQAANCAAQTGTSNAQTASPGSTSIGNSLDPKPTGSTAAANSRGPIVPAHAPSLAVAPNPAFVPPPIPSTILSPASPATPPSSVVSFPSPVSTPNSAPTTTTTLADELPAQQVEHASVPQKPALPLTPVPAPTSPTAPASPLSPKHTPGAATPASTPPAPPPPLPSLLPPPSETATDMSDSHQSAAAAVPPASPSVASLPDQFLSQAPTLHGASASGFSSQDAMTADSNFRQTTTSGAGLDKAPSATDDLLSPQLHENLPEHFEATQADETVPESSPVAAAETLPNPAAETTAATAAQIHQLSDQTGPQQPISGAAAGNQPHTTPQTQAQDSEPAQVQIDSSAATQSDDSSDSSHSSSEVPHAPATSNAGGLEWLTFTTSAGVLLAAVGLWMIHRSRDSSRR